MIQRVPLLLDVDGVLNVSAASPGEASERGLVAHWTVDETGVSYSMLLDPQVGGRLLQLAESFELVWCTTWQNANEAISPLVGVATELRRVPLAASWTHTTPDPGWSWKVPYIRSWAGERGIERLAWVDDDIHPMDARVLITDFSRRHPGHLLAATPPLTDVLPLRIPPERGLEDHHVTVLREWAGA